MAEKKQWNIRVEDQLIDRLNRLAPKAGFTSGNEFAAEVLDVYAEILADLIVELRKIEQDAVRTQRQQMLDKLRQLHTSADLSSDRRK